MTNYVVTVLEGYYHPSKEFEDRSFAVNYAKEILDDEEAKGNACLVLVIDLNDSKNDEEFKNKKRIKQEEINANRGKKARESK